MPLKTCSLPRVKKRSIDRRKWLFHFCWRVHQTEFVILCINSGMHEGRCWSVEGSDRKDKLLTFRVNINCCCFTDFYKSICRLLGVSSVWICSWNSGVFWSLIVITAMSDNMLSWFNICDDPLWGWLRHCRLGLVETCIHVSTIPIRECTGNCQQLFCFNC